WPYRAYSAATARRRCVSHARAVVREGRAPSPLGTRRTGAITARGPPLRQARRRDPVRQHRHRRLRPEWGICHQDEDAALSEEPPSTRATAGDLAFEAPRRALGHT